MTTDDLERFMQQPALQGRWVEGDTPLRATLQTMGWWEDAGPTAQVRTASFPAPPSATGPLGKHLQVVDVVVVTRPGEPMARVYLAGSDD